MRRLYNFNPQSGEIWRVRLDPIVGSEQGKTRPVVVLSQPPIGRPSIRLCAVVTQGQPAHQGMVWCVALLPNAASGLIKESTADTAQTRALDLARFETQIGALDADKMDEIRAALIRAIGGVPPAS